MFNNKFLPSENIANNNNNNNNYNNNNNNNSDFIWDFGKLPFPPYLGKYFMKNGKISAKILEIGKIKAIFRLGMTPI